MILSHAFIIFFIISDQIILTESLRTVYTVEGHTVNLTFSMITSDINVSLNKRYIYHNIDHAKVNTKKYNMVLHPNILEFQIINLTTKDTGTYWLINRGLSSTYIHVTSKF